MKSSDLTHYIQYEQQVMFDGAPCLPPNANLECLTGFVFRREIKANADQTTCVDSRQKLPYQVTQAVFQDYPAWGHMLIIMSAGGLRAARRAQRARR